MTKEHQHLASRVAVLWWCAAGCSASAKPGVQSGSAEPAPRLSHAPRAPTSAPPPTAATPTTAPAPTLLVSDISAGERHVCALGSTGDVWCWGANDSKQIASTTVDLYASPVRIPLPLAARSVTVADRASCAILNDGRRACWGYGRKLAIDTSHRFERSVPTWPANCALTPGRELICGGYNYFGVLGFPIGERGEFQKDLSFRVVPLAGRVEQVVVAGDLGCALVGPERKLFCWGNGWGCDGPEPIDSPAQVVGLTGGGDRVCLLAANGDVHEFSALNELHAASDATPNHDPKGQFCHDRDEGVRRQPRKIAEGASDVSCFARARSRCSACSGCIVDRQQRLLCWQNDAERRDSVIVPTVVEDISRPRRIAVGDSFYCAVLESGLLECWGQNRYGQLGRGHVSAAEAAPKEPAWPPSDPGGDSLAPARE